MDINRLKELLHSAGELIVVVEEVGEVELHKHDTTLRDGEVRVSLEDGKLFFDAERVTLAARHKGSLADVGLE